MLIELVGKLRFLNEYGELETVKPVDREEASDGAAGAGMVSFVSLLVIFFVFTG